MGEASRGDSRYVLDNAGAQAPERFTALAAIFDPGTIRHLTERGVAAGWHCLEVGAGGGSIACWLAERVGSSGRVLATDIDPRFLTALERPNLEVQRHDVAVDPLPERSFDLVHARLVLVHLKERERALERMVAALRPGGWLLLEEFDSLSTPPDPVAHPGEVLLPAIDAMRRVMAARGVDSGYGRSLVPRMRAHGLREIDAEARMFMWRGGSPGAALLRTGLEQLRGAVIEASEITAEVYDRDVRRLADPDYLAPSPILWAAWGRRPSA
jgi:SAM-dependent methyltransferase